MKRWDAPFASFFVIICVTMRKHKGISRVSRLGAFMEVAKAIEDSYSNDKYKQLGKE
jgi:hypothetical protein